MKLLRTVLFTVGLVLLAAGYAASQVSYLNGTFQDYAGRVDSGPVRVLALLYLACCVALPWVGGPSETPNP